MSIDPVLVSIQQHAPKHPELLKLLMAELERDPTQIEKLITLLKDSDSTRLRLKYYVERVFDHKDISYCLIESGISNRTGFSSEIFRKFKHSILPEAGDNSTLHETLFRISNFKVFTTEQLTELLSALEIEVDFNHQFLKNELIDAIEVLSYRVTAMAIESEFISRFKNNQTVTSFIRQNKEIHALIAQHVLGIQFNPHLVTHIRTLLTDSLHDVAKLRRVSNHQGASLQLTYSLYRITQQIERLNLMLDLYLQPKLQPQQIASFIKQISENEQKKNSIRSLLNETTYLVAYQISEHESITGEHYIADTRKEHIQMFLSSCIGGLVAVWMAIVKIFLHTLPFAPFWQSFVYSINYASGFIGIQVFHGTLATKQPAMTAAKIAHSLDTQNHSEQEAIKGLALMLGKVSRSQFISFAGNLIIVFPLAAILAAVWPYVFGKSMIDTETAKHLLKDVHPFSSPTIWYASITGIMLFVSGIISGYYDNKVVYSNIPARLRRHPLLKKLLSKRNLIRFSKYIEHNLGSLVGNTMLGFFLGMAGFIGFIFGIPFDIRHITIASANYAVAVVTLLPELDWRYALTCLLGVVGIGLFNFIMSFGPALFVAIRSRKVKFKEFRKLMRFTFSYFFKHPSDFFFSPKQERNVADL
jgi:site-specific recombinase